MLKISILTPIYGVEKYIEQCARSLFEQSYASIEYIFVDDCTPDNSIGILQSLLKEYSNEPEYIEEQPTTLEDTEKETIKKALLRNHGKRKKTAEELKISERTLYRKIKEYNLE